MAFANRLSERMEELRIPSVRSPNKDSLYNTLTSPPRADNSFFAFQQQPALSTPGTSRSAPEIDALEASVGTLDTEGNQIGVVSQSFQVAPFDIWYQPNHDFVEVNDFSITEMNVYKGGPFQEAFSDLLNLNNQWYDGNAYQVYAFEYAPGASGDQAPHTT